MDAVTVVCDRCHRPGWRLTVSEVTGEVVIDGARIPDMGADTSPYWRTVLSGRRSHRYSPDQGGARPGAFIVPAGRDYSTGREKLVCVGRKHPRYERVVTAERAARAYLAADQAGRSRIGMRDI